MPRDRPLPPPSLQPIEWLTKRLENISDSDPRFEASWYGAYNALLSHYFPHQQQFLIKPQPKIRELEVGDGDEDGDISFSSVQAESSVILDEDGSGVVDEANTSVTSMGGFAKRGGKTFIPDFIVVKGTEFASHDKALLLVEVKVRDPGRASPLRMHKLQMSLYMEALAEYMQVDSLNKLVGLLVCGRSVNVFTVGGSAASRGPKSKVRLDGLPHDINSTAIRRLLLDIAKENWRC